MAVCIQTSRLTKRYGTTVAVDDLSFEVQSGEVMGLLGPNGAGKSTTLYMLAGLVRPNSGKITVFGKERHKNFLEIARRMGVVVERPTFYDYLTARENLLLFAKLAGQDVTVDRALDLVGLLEVGRKKAGALSMGMRQRLGLAQAILTEPELLLLDEPVSGLDPEAAHEVLGLLRRLADESKITIVYSSHMLDDVELLCDRITIIDKGRLVACDKVDTLLSYDQGHVEVLVDAPEAAAKRLDEEAWVESVQVWPGKIEVKLAKPNVHQLAAFLVGAGYRVSGIIPRRKTLRDYFLRVLNS